MNADPVSATLPDPIVAVELNIQSGHPQPPSITLPIWDSKYAWLDGDGYQTWTAKKQSALPSGYETRQSHQNQAGLWIWPIGSVAAGWKTYPPGYAEFAFKAPGTTRIARAMLDTEYRNGLYLTHCTEFGLRTSVTNRDRDRDCIAPLPDRLEVGVNGEKAFREVALFDPSGSPTATDLYARIQIPSCAPLPDSLCSKWIATQDPLHFGPYLRVSKVAMTLVDDDLPVVMPSGAFFDLDDTYIDGKQVYPLQIDDSDAGAGIYATQFDHTTPAPSSTLESLGSKPAVCDPTHNTASLGSRICPQTDALPLTIDTNPFPEGTNRLRAWAVDPAGNIADRSWNVKVDRTPPPAPPNMSFLTPDEGSAQVAWSESIDPALADGTPASGTKHYRYRSQINGGAWSDWIEIDAPRQVTNEVFDQPIGTQVAFEVVAVDLVGNVSEPTTAGGIVIGEFPDLQLGGALAAIDNDFTNGQSLISFDVSATDVSSGVRKLQVARQGGGNIGETLAPCTDAANPLAPGKLTCPTSFSASYPVDVRPWSEGEHVVTVQAIDRATNEDSDEMTIYVDRSGPSAPTDLDIALETDVMQAAVTWGDGADPQLSDGSDPSGTRESQYRYRSVGSGAWTNWIATQEEGFDLPGVSLGDQYELEVRSVDEVDNLGPTTSQVLTVDQELPQSGRLRVCADDAVWLGNNASSSTTIHSLNYVKIYARHSSGKLYTLRTDPNSVAGPGCTQVRLIEGNYNLSAYYGSNPISFKTEQHPNTTTGHNGLTSVSMTLPHSSGTSDYVRAWAGYYAGSDRRDCRLGSSCGRFDVDAAVSYARSYGEISSPPGYLNQGGDGDCTNFLSQVLRAGGLTFGNEYETRSDSGNQAWWYLKYGTPINSGEKFTPSWVRAEALVDHLRHRRLVSSPFKRPTLRNVGKIRARRGDIFAFNWFGEGNVVDHLAIVTGHTSDGSPLLSYHSSNVTDRPWRTFVQLVKEQRGDYGDAWTFDRYRPVDTRFND